MIDEKKIELMKKLQRLAERGVGGEKEGAQKKLQQLMKKYDIEESDLSDDKLEDHEWKYHNDFELRLLKQTIYKVMGKDGLNQMYHYRSGKGKKTIQGVQCTKVQAIQIGIEYEYKQAGNSIAVPIFESIFRKIILNETAQEGTQWRT